MIAYQSVYREAQARVYTSPRLNAYAEVILANWPMGEMHWQWVLTASEDEIIAWAQEADLRDEEDDDRT